MATVHIILRDTEDGLVDVETTITAMEPGSNAIGLADRLNQHMAEIATELQSPTPKPELMCDLGKLTLVKGVQPT